MTEVTASSLAQSQQVSQQQTQKLSQDFDDFLVLLTTQMQNQDPLSPMESTEFTNQLIGFSQVEQQINSNEKLDQLLSLQLSNISSVALGYVGMEVNYLGNAAYHDGQSEMDFRYAIDGEAVKAKLNITDEQGVVVRSIDVDTAGGTATWDGKDEYGNYLEAGNYGFNVDALDATGGGLQTQLSVPGKVVGIEAQDGIIKLLLEGDTTVSLGSVLSAQEATDTAGNNETENTNES